MPWINKEMCVACGICVEECPAGAISISEAVAVINDDECIRCGHCHEVCPQEAVRHDGEKVPVIVEKNIDWIRKLMSHDYYKTAEKKKGLLKRMSNAFNMQIKIAEQTLERIEEIGKKL